MGTETLASFKHDIYDTYVPHSMHTMYMHAYIESSRWKAVFLPHSLCLMETIVETTKI
jgi:hypothetical protein